MWSSVVYLGNDTQQIFVSPGFCGSAAQISLLELTNCRFDKNSTPQNLGLTLKISNWKDLFNRIAFCSSPSLGPEGSGLKVFGIDSFQKKRKTKTNVNI